MNEEYVEPKGRIERSWIVVDVDPRNPQDAHLVFRILGANYGTVPLALLIDRKECLQLRDAIDQAFGK